MISSIEPKRYAALVNAPIVKLLSELLAEGAAVLLLSCIKLPPFTLAISLSAAVPLSGLVKVDSRIF